MATHEQEFLGPVFEQMEEEGLLSIEGANSYELATRFVALATAAGVVIDADIACAECSAPLDEAND